MTARDRGPVPGRPPSITSVVNQFPSPSETFVRRKVEGLRDAGVAVGVAAASFGPDARVTGVPLHPLAPWQDPRRSLPLTELRAWPALAAAVVRGAPGQQGLRARVLGAPVRALPSDVVHFEFSGIAVTYRDSIQALQRTGRRVAVSCRGSAEKSVPQRDPARAALLAQVFDRVDLIHCVSDDMRRTAEDLGAPPERIVVNRPAVPVADYRSLRRDEHQELHADAPLRVLSVGRLQPVKGLDDGLRAIAALVTAGRPVSYRIVGDGPERGRLEQLVDELGLGGVVELTGTRTPAQVRELLGWSDVLLLPSLSEGISNAALEAMAAGRPVVSTDCGGMREVITDGHDGMVVAVGDDAAMASRLGTLAADPALGRRLGARAAERADRDFGLDRQVQVFLDAYSALFDA